MLFDFFVRVSNVLFFLFSFIFQIQNTSLAHPLSTSLLKPVMAESTINPRDVIKKVEQASSLLIKNKDKEKVEHLIDSVQKDYYELFFEYLACTSKLGIQDDCQIKKVILDEILNKLSELNLKKKFLISVLESKKEIYELEHSVRENKSKLIELDEKLKDQNASEVDLKSKIHEQDIIYKSMVDKLFAYRVTCSLLFIIAIYLSFSIFFKNKIFNKNIIKNYAEKISITEFKTTLTCIEYEEFKKSVRLKDGPSILATQKPLIDYISKLKGKNKIFRASETLIRLDQDIFNTVGTDAFIEYLTLEIPRRLGSSEAHLSEQAQALLSHISSCGAMPTKSSVRAHWMSQLAESVGLTTSNRSEDQWRFDLAHVMWALSYHVLCESSQRLEFQGIMPMSERPMNQKFRWFGDGRLVHHLHLPHIRLCEVEKEIHSIQGEGELM